MARISNRNNKKSQLQTANTKIKETNEKASPKWTYMKRKSNNDDGAAVAEIQETASKPKQTYTNRKLNNDDDEAAGAEIQTKARKVKPKSKVTFAIIERYYHN